MYRLSLAHASLVFVSPLELVRIAAATGFTATGLRLVATDRPRDSLEALARGRDTAAIRQEASDSGVEVLDIEVVQIRDDFTPLDYLPALEAGAECGARFVVTNVYTPDAALAQDHLAELCGLARPLGLTIALEFVSFSHLRTLTRTLDMVRRSGADNACVLIDTLHFHSSRAPLDELASVPPELVHYVHVADGPAEVPADDEGLRSITREGRLLPGEGGIDIAGILRRLPKNIVCAVEAQNPSRANAMGAEAYARLEHETTLRYLSAMD